MRKMQIILAAAALLLISGCSTTTNDFLASHLGTPAVKETRQSLSSSLRLAHKLEKDGDWVKARAAYKEALAHYPQSKKLKSRYHAFKGRYTARIARVEIDAIIGKAEWLKQQHKYRKATDSNYRGEHWAEVVQLSKQLAQKGERAMQRNQMSLAKRALQESVKIHSNRTTRNAYGRYQAYKERIDFARLVRKGRKMAAVSTGPVRM